MYYVKDPYRKSTPHEAFQHLPKSKITSQDCSLQESAPSEGVIACLTRVTGQYLGGKCEN